MPQPSQPVFVKASDVPKRVKPSVYPTPFSSRVNGRDKHPLGDIFGLSNFGVNLTKLSPGSSSALRHAHSKQDEFIFVLEGTPTLCTDEGKTVLSPGMCAGFKASTGNAHCLINESSDPVVYLEIGDRTSGDQVTYPDDDLMAILVEGGWVFSHKDGTPYA